MFLTEQLFLQQPLKEIDLKQQFNREPDMRRGNSFVPSKMSRIKYPSFVSGTSNDHLSARLVNASSETTSAACSFILCSSNVN